ncbi:MAG: secretin N-terminal domain-containing protein [Phycisphaerales bacterium]
MIRVDAESNSLVVRADAAQFEMIRRTVASIDGASFGAARQLRVLPVDPGQASAADVAAAIERLFGGGDGGSLVEVVSLESLLESAGSGSGTSSGSGSDVGSGSSTPPAGGSVDARIAPWSIDVDALPPTMVRGVIDALVGSVIAGPMQAVEAPDDGRAPVGIDRLIEEESVLGRAARSAPAAERAGRTPAPRVAEPAAPAPIATPAAAPAPSMPAADDDSLDARIARAVAAVEAARSGTRSPADVLPSVDDARSTTESAVEDGTAAPSAPPATDSAAASALAPAPAPAEEASAAEPTAEPTAESTDASAPDAPAPDSMDDRVARAIAAAEARAAEREAAAAARIAAAAESAAAAADAPASPSASPSAADAPSATPASAPSAASAPAADLNRAAIASQPVDTSDDAAVTVAVDRERNALVVLGPPRTVERIEALAAQLAEQLPGESRPVRAIPLPGTADAGRIRQLAIEVLRRIAPPGGSAGAINDRVGIVADTDANTLYVVASDTDFRTVGRLIAGFAGGAATETSTVRVYPLATTTASRARAALEALISGGNTGQNRNRRSRQSTRPARGMVAVPGGAGSVVGPIDASRVRVIADEQSNTLLVIAPADSLDVLDAFVELIDRAPATESASLRLFPLRNARANDVRGSLRGILRDRFDAARRLPGGPTIRPEVTVDARTNTLIVSAAPEQLAEVEALLADLDRDLGSADLPLEIIQLRSARPSNVADLIEEVIVGRDADRRATMQITPDDDSGRLMLRIPPALRPEIERVIAAVDQEATEQLPVRTIELERANAEAVASALQQFFDDRARLADGRSGRRTVQRKVSIIGNAASRSLLVAASDEDFAEVEELVAGFDVAGASDRWAWRLVPLTHARAGDLAQSVSQFIQRLDNDEMNSMWSGRRRPESMNSRGSVSVAAEDRLNALIVSGEGEKFELVEEMIAALDVPTDSDRGVRTAEAYRIGTGDVRVIADLIEQVFGDSNRQWWEDPDPNAIQVRTDRGSGTIYVVGTAIEQESIRAFVESLDNNVGNEPILNEVIAVEYVPADEVARTLQDFLRERARIAGGGDRSTIVRSNRTAGAVVVAGTADDLAVVRELLSQLDQPDRGDRTTEIIAIEEGEAAMIADIVRDQFGGRGREDAVRVTVDERSNSLIVSAPRQQYDRVAGLVQRLDQRDPGDETIVQIYTLESADVLEAETVLTRALDLDGLGRTEGSLIKLDPDGEAVKVVASIVGDSRSNTLIVTGTPESFPVIERLIRQLDEAPAAAPSDYRIVDLEHAFVDDVVFTLERVGEWPGDPKPRFVMDRVENRVIVTATAPQFEIIEQMIADLDQPVDRTRRTEFVAMEFAEARKVREALGTFYGILAFEAATPEARNVRITADEATNSLVISADESEWEGITALINRLDSPEYDASQQLRVIALDHADADRVARAINEVFATGRQQNTNRNQRGNQNRNQEQNGDGGEGENADGGNRRERQPQPVTPAPGSDLVRAASEPLTNSLIVSASRRNLLKIESIVSQLDVPDVERLPAPRLIAVPGADPDAIATALNNLYADDAETSRGMLKIVGDAASGTVIVRAEDASFQQISGVAEQLLAASGGSDIAVAVLTPASAPAARIASAIESAYQAKAERRGAVLTLQVDPAGNSIIVGAPADLLADIRATVDELDRLSPGTGQGIFIIELENVDPQQVQQTIRRIGLDRPAPANATGRITTEPITVAPVPGRRAVIVLANPADRETIVGLLKTLDAEPALIAAETRLVRLQRARASTVTEVLRGMLDPASGPTGGALARAAQEQIRRLTVRRDGLDEADLELDLAEPVRLVADDGSNVIFVSSSAGNAEALVELIGTLDSVPLVEGLTVQLLPMQNIEAAEFVRITQELFRQGRELGRVPGSELVGIPGGTVGQALLDAVALSVDARTNTVIVAGKEDAVALVEVLGQRLDADVAVGWVEPRIVALQHADAEELATTLEAILVEGRTDAALAGPLRNQVGRLRMARDGGPLDPGGDAPGLPGGVGVIESDVFQPMQRLVIRPDAQMNSLLVVGTPDNLEIIDQLVSMLDIPAASPDAAVRLYPVKHASASRLSTTLQRLFQQQVRASTMREEDALVIEADERTNTLVVSTSRRSFIVLENLLTTLDAPLAPEFRDIRRLQLRTASAARIGNLVQEMMNARLERLRRLAPEAAEMERATVIPDPTTNSLIIAAGNESYAVIERLVNDLDTERTDDSLLEVVAVRRADVERLAETIDQVMERRYADLPGDLQRSQRPLVVTDPRTSSLLVAAAPEDLADIQSLVARLDAEPADPSVGLHVLQVPARTSAEALADRLERLLRDRQRSIGANDRGDQVTIEAEPGSNTLIVAADRENLAVVENLLEVLVAAGEDAIAAEEFDVLTLASSRATDIVELVEELYVDEARDTRGDGAVSVTADERINAVLVRGTPEDIAAIRALVGRLDAEKPSAVVEIRTLALKSASAQETVDLIDSVLDGGGGRVARGSAEATVLRYLGPLASGDPAAGEFEVSGAIRDRIRLTPDTRTNAIIVRAPADALRLIEQLVQDLDESSIGAQNIRIFNLQNADATAMSGILAQLFNLNRSRDGFVLRPTDGAAATPAGGGSLDGANLTAVPDRRPQLSITVDSRTNSLIVSGTPTYLDLVDDVVAKLDRLEANERETFTYQLRNARAEEVAQVLGDFVREEQEKLVGTLDGDQIGSAARLLEREITISGDPTSNSVLVSVSPRYRSKVEELITSLDIDPPQVLIQVLLAEVTLDTEDRWGVDFSSSNPVDDVLLGPAFGLASAFVGGVGTPSLSVVGKDFQLLLQAIQSQGRVQVLSNPSIMAANNEAAELFVGERIRVAETSNVSDSGNLNTGTIEERVGLTLNVTPSINPDGFVRLDVLPELSALTRRTTQINEDLTAPIITERSANTTVTVRDGQTIVIGGLISDRYEFRRRKVPFFGDLPLVGPIFRNDDETSLKTELLIVLTPHVIQSPTELARTDFLTDREIDRMTLPDAVRDQLRRGLFEDSGLYDAEGNPVPWEEVFGSGTGKK